MILKKKYEGLSFYENFLSGHLSIGPVTIYGENAMHWAVNIHTRKWGYICFRMPLRCFGKWWPLYFYCSPNGTPWASTFYIGSSKTEKKESKERRLKYGHNFNADLLN
jgi:hypothetical protein